MNSDPTLRESELEDGIALDDVCLNWYGMRPHPIAYAHPSPRVFADAPFRGITVVKETDVK